MFWTHISLQLDPLIWKTASPRTHLLKIENESLLIYFFTYDIYKLLKLQINWLHLSQSDEFIGASLKGKNMLPVGSKFFPTGSIFFPSQETPIKKVFNH